MFAVVRQRSPQARCRRGQVLVEFALIALVMYLLLAATIEFGRMILAAQTIHSAADLAARELARTPLSPTGTLDEALRQPAAREIFDEHYLVISLDELPEGTGVMDYVATMPIVNRQLFPLMVLNYVGGQRLLRYPGALVEDLNPDDNPPGALNGGLLVKVPVLIGNSEIGWHNVLEPVRSGPAPEDDSFSIASAQRGLIALRIHYPFQAAAMSGFARRVNEQGQPDQFAGNVDLAIDADDAVLVDPGLPDGAMPVAPDPPPGSDYGGTYGGAYGLGEQGAFARTVRPYRRVVTANGIARREVFNLQQGP